jgi:hypothetical protein
VIGARRQVAELERGRRDELAANAQLVCDEVDRELGLDTIGLASGIRSAAGCGDCSF